jgi:hypothetical protein
MQDFGNHESPNLIIQNPKWIHLKTQVFVHPEHTILDVAGISEIKQIVQPVEVQEFQGFANLLDLS